MSDEVRISSLLEDLHNMTTLIIRKDYESRFLLFNLNSYVIPLFLMFGVNFGTKMVANMKIMLIFVA